MQQQIIPRSKIIQHPVNIFLRLHLICPAVQNDTVLFFSIHLYDSMATLYRKPLHIGNVNAIISAELKQHISVLSNNSRMVHRNPRFRQCNGLVQPFAAAKRLQP